MSTSRIAGSLHERGFALLIVLWSLVLLALLGTGIVAAGRTETQLAGNLRNAAVTEAAADGAVYRTVFLLLGGDTSWSPVGYYRFSDRGVVAEVRVESLAGRVNPNIAQPDLLRALLAELGVNSAQAASLTAAILDWSTPGQRPRPLGARLPEYRAAGLDYGPPGTPFQSVDEVGAVLGMTPELLARLRPHLTVWWENEPDPAATDPVVLAALRTLGADDRRAGERQPAPVILADIRAEAAGPGGSGFTRHAVVGIIAAASGGQKSWRFLAWDTNPP